MECPKCSRGERVIAKLQCVNADELPDAPSMTRAELYWCPCGVIWSPERSEGEVTHLYTVWLPEDRTIAAGS